MKKYLAFLLASLMLLSLLAGCGGGGSKGSGTPSGDSPASSGADPGGAAVVYKDTLTWA